MGIGQIPSKPQEAQANLYTITTTQHLAAVVNGNSQTDTVARAKVTTDTTNSSLSRGVGIVNSTSVGSDRRASTTESITDLHALDRKTSVLDLNSRDIEARPAVVGSGAEVELAPGGSVATGRISRDSGALSSGPATLGVIGESDVDRRAGGKSEGVAGVAVPAVHLAILAVLVPDSDGPVVGAGALELGNVLVLAGIRGGDLNDVAAVGVADVARVGHVATGGTGAATEAGGGRITRGKVGPGRVGAGAGRRRRATGGSSLAALEALSAGRSSEGARGGAGAGNITGGNVGPDRLGDGGRASSGSSLATLEARGSEGAGGEACK